MPKLYIEILGNLPMVLVWFDLGAIYKTDSGYQFGAMLRDATTTVNFWTINQKEFQLW
jgi:hypothetical protein